MGKEILVTGSSRGIGKEIALYLAENGFDIVLHCRNNLQQAQEVQKLIQKTGQKSRILQFDVKDRKKCFEIITEDIKQNGAYFGVVLNAGIAMDNVFPIMTESTRRTGFRGRESSTGLPSWRQSVRSGMM